MQDIEDQGSLVEYISTLDGVRKVNQSEAAANALTTFNVLVGYISIAIIGVLLLVSIFLISNTVTVGITVRKEEIAIMKLIGARDGFVRAPFLIEGGIDWPDGLCNSIGSAVLSVQTGSWICAGAFLTAHRVSAVSSGKSGVCRFGANCSSAWNGDWTCGECDHSEKASEGLAIEV